MAVGLARPRVEGEWKPRFALAAVVRMLAYGIPLGAGSGVAALISRALTGAQHPWLAAGTVLGAAVVVSLLVSHLTMRLMPLAVLLRMTMIFPDRAPSRLKVARLATSMRDITSRLRSRSDDESEAATTMLALVTALGRHDRRTRGHSERVRLFCDLLCKQVGLSAADSGRLRWAALIHDIGKLEVAAEVLNKPAALNEEEWVVIRRHPETGARLAQPLASWLGPWFNGIAEHHERWDGGGYPTGLAGDGISAAGRAIAVVDAFETMTSARSYKSARSTLSARTELAMCSGAHFDPTMVRAFLAISLPKLLWSVGPLAFLVNVPHLRWVVEGGVRTVDVATAATAATANAAGVAVVAVTVGALPAGATGALPHLGGPARPATVQVATTSGGHAQADAAPGHGVSAARSHGLQGAAHAASTRPSLPGADRGRSTSAPGQDHAGRDEAKREKAAAERAAAKRDEDAARAKDEAAAEEAARSAEDAAKETSQAEQDAAEEDHSGSSEPSGSSGGSGSGQVSSHAVYQSGPSGGGGHR